MTSQYSSLESKLRAWPGLALAHLSSLFSLHPAGLSLYFVPASRTFVLTLLGFGLSLTCLVALDMDYHFSVSLSVKGGARTP